MIYKEKVIRIKRGGIQDGEKKKYIGGGWKKHGKTTPFYAMRRICRFPQRFKRV